MGSSGKPPAKTSNAFVRFINLVRAIETLPSGLALDAQEERLFHELAVLWARGECVPVHVALTLLSDASSSTAKRRLRSLEAKGWVTLERVPEDARLRCVSATPAGQAYIDRLGQLIEKAGRGA